MPLTCPVVLTLPSSASSLTEESPFPLSPPSHYELRRKSLGVSVVENHWRPVQNISKRQVNGVKGSYSINISGTLTPHWLSQSTESLTLNLEEN